MRPAPRRTRIVWGVAAAGLVGALTLAGNAAGAQPTYALTVVAPYQTSVVGPYGGEPYIVSDPSGVLYDSSPSLGASAFRSIDAGKTWTPTAVADANSGDTALGTDQSGAVYLANLAGSVSAAPLQGDVYKSTDQGRHWVYGNPFALGGTVCGTSCIPFGVDRQWVDGYIAPGKTTAQSTVVFMYHDFYGPSHIWVNVSTDGGQSFGPPTDILTHFTPSAPAAVAAVDTFCNTVPVGVQIAKGGPHAGRMYAAWIASDPAADLTGCNISQAEAFHNLIVAWSDDGGSTWTPQIAFDGGPLHDASSPFAGFALDSQGNPYFGFTMNLNSDASCDLPTNPQTPNCEFDSYVVWSNDGGTTWDGGGGTITSGTAATPYKVNSDVGTHFFPWIAAAAPGHVVMAYLRTPSIIATSANGKEQPGSCYTGVNCPFTGAWNLWAAQSSDLTAAPGAAHFTTTQITSTPIHVGDICNLGIACVPRVSNRNLLDFISVAIDPQGCAHIAFADDNTINKLLAANQTSGCFQTAAVTTTPVPTATSSAAPVTATTTGLANTGRAVPGALLASLLTVGGLAVRQRRGGRRRR